MQRYEQTVLSHVLPASFLDVHSEVIVDNDSLVFRAQIENCLDRHVKTNPESVALIWEKDEPGTHETVTYR